MRFQTRGQWIANVLQDDFHILTHRRAYTCDELYREIQGNQCTAMRMDGPVNTRCDNFA